MGNEFTVVGEVGEVGGAGENAVDAKGDRFLYRSMVEIIPATTQYRPLRRTPAPVIQGPQTAVVVGPKAETITTDKLGRIKVQFFWDREGKKDDNSSCWIRVAQSWAGKGFGGLIIPRIGQEVVVDFIHGNPDWPLVTGVVYNATNDPPETLPADKTRSTFRTHTDRGAVNAYNELRFEDKRGQEEVYLKAQKDHNVEVGDVYSIDVKTQYVLTSSPTAMAPGQAAATPGTSRIEVTPDKIRFVVTRGDRPADHRDQRHRHRHDRHHDRHDGQACPRRRHRLDAAGDPGPADPGAGPGLDRGGAAAARPRIADAAAVAEAGAGVTAGHGQPIAARPASRAASWPQPCWPAWRRSMSRTTASPTGRAPRSRHATAATPAPDAAPDEPAAALPALDALAASPLADLPPCPGGGG